MDQSTRRIITMEPLNPITFIPLITLSNVVSMIIKRETDWKPKQYNINDRYCRKLADSVLNFNVTMVMGEPWIIYYTWNADFTDICDEHRFFHPPKAVIKVFEYSLKRYLKVEPDWEAPSLLWDRPNITDDVLLFQDSKPGLYSYHGLSSEYSISLRKPHMINLYKYQLGFLDEKYLVIVHCDTGEVFLMARPKEAPARVDVERVVGPLDFGAGGLHACVR